MNALRPQKIYLPLFYGIKHYTENVFKKKKKKKKKKVLRHGFSLQSAESEHSDANVFPAAGADSVLG